MSLRSRLASAWKALTHREQMESELETELQFHRDSYAGDLIRQGVPPQEAERRARVELGSAVHQQEECRESFGVRFWDELRGDLRYAARQLRSAPGFALTALVVLALGIGASTAMFSVLHATLFKPLPYEAPGRLVTLRELDAKGNFVWNFYADIREWQQQSKQLSAIGYFAPNRGYLETPYGVYAASAPLVSANLFSVIRVQPILGRGFLPDEQSPGTSKVLVLSYSLWRNLFHSDPQVVGKTVKLDDDTYTILGVMPGGFEFPANEDRAQVWRPVPITSANEVRNFSTMGFEVVGRLAHEATVASAQTELSGIQQRLAPLFRTVMQGQDGPSRVEMKTYLDSLVSNLRPALLALLAAVSILWLIACANVANLMLARGIARQRELAVRGALGAGRLRIVRQLFTESLLLASCGSALGLALAAVTLRVFSKGLSSALNVPHEITPDFTVIAALLLLTLLSAALFGLLPAWLAARAPIESSLRQNSAQAQGSRRRHRLQQGMVAAEIGLSLVLLVACGLMLKTLFALRHVPLGFRTDHVLVVEPKVPEYKFRNIDVSQAVYRPLLERVQQMHGVQAASISTVMPLRNTFDMMFMLHGSRSNKTTGENGSFKISAKMKAVGRDLQKVLGFRMAEGRFFNEQDTPESQQVAVVNKTFAKLYAPEGSLTGNFTLSFGKKGEVKVVGVIDDFHQVGVDKPAAPEIDLCAEQMQPGDGLYQPTMQAHAELAIRTSASPEQLMADLRRVMVDLNPDLQASEILTMDQVVEDSLGSQLLAAHLLEIFAGTALGVALAGLFGLLTYLVGQRTRELGIRMALGAQRETIVAMILKQATLMLVTGGLLGIALAWFTSRMLASFLFGVSPHDAWTIAAVSAVLVTCGLFAAYIPARRAAQVNPLEALRAE
jgi:predicted permease